MDNSNLDGKINGALRLFGAGWSCSQVILMSYCEEFGISQETAAALACGFSGGFRRGEICGAISGAVTVIGLYSSRASKNSARQKEVCFNTMEKFIKEFEKKNKFILCKDLLSFDLEDEMALKKYPSRQAEICPMLVISSIEILNECIKNMEQTGS